MEEFLCVFWRVGLVEFLLLNVGGVVGGGLGFGFLSLKRLLNLRLRFLSSLVCV